MTDARTTFLAELHRQLVTLDCPVHRASLDEAVANALRTAGAMVEQEASALTATPIDLAGLLRMLRIGHAQVRLDRSYIELLLGYIDRLEEGYRKIVELAVDAEPAGRAGRAYDVGRMAGLDAAMMAVPEIVDSAPFRFSSADRAPGGG